MENKLIEIGTQLGSDHAWDRERFRTHWEEHVRNSCRMILEGARRVTEPGAVTILGGGAAYNLPLEELTTRFSPVRLIDIDRDGVQKALDGLTDGARSKIEIQVADVTGGMAARLLGRALEIVNKAANAEDALTHLVPLFSGDGGDGFGATTDRSRIDDWKASYVISSGLSSQLTIFPEKGVLNALHDKFGTELEEEFFFRRGSFHLRNEWVRRHGELLGSLVSPGGRVYWADTVAETPYLSEFGSAPLSLMIDAVANFLDRAYLKTFLTDPGKAVLAERFTEGLRGARITGDDLIKSFNGKTHAEQKRRFAWALMTLVGECFIMPQRELDLVTFVIREAERHFPHARLPLLDGGKLSGFFPGSLEPEGEMASWLWVNDPEGAVTLEGYSYYVDAHILRQSREARP